MQITVGRGNRRTQVEVSPRTSEERDRTAWELKRALHSAGIIPNLGGRNA